MRYLTKSRFKLALECPTKLFYTKKLLEYYDRKPEDDFLQALADGGHQVGALAQAYYPGGHCVDSLDEEKAVRETDDLLRQENVIIFEAAFRYRTLFVRTDIVVKNGPNVRLIEVKAKSCVPQDGATFVKTSGEQGRAKLSSDWESYLCDVAFQHYVVQKARPDLNVRAWLMCADKSKAATVDGLNRRFQIAHDSDGRSRIRLSGPVDPEALGARILHEFDVSEIVARIQSGELFSSPLSLTELGTISALPGLPANPADAGKLTAFEKTVFFLAGHYERDDRIAPEIGTKCKSCEFQASPEKRAQGFKSGFRECWKQAAGFKDADFDRPLTLQVWNWRGREKKIDAGKYFQKDLSAADFPKEHTEPTGALSSQGRQWLQCRMSEGKISEAHLQVEWLKQEIAQWKFPLHFIDFETSTAALPYHAGRQPYEVVAFQFSHHVAEANGKIRHAGEYIMAQPGVFPNFDFVRALETQLGQDDGTIFRYSMHENTVLNHIARQLGDSNEPDRDRLIDFIESITQPTKSGKNADDREAGRRNMRDLCDVVKKGYYHVLQNGSNSIKAVLPAILNSSVYLQEKYREPVYGGAIPSRNFPPMPLVKFEPGGSVRSPYVDLLPVLDKLERTLLEKELIYGDEDVIKEGGAASVAYGKIQFTEMTEAEREAVGKALLTYCELDTMAMVLLWEYLQHEIANR